MLLLQDSQSASTTSHASGLLHYTLSPDKLAQAYALYRIDVSLYFLTTLYVFVVLWLMLRTHYGVRLRDLAERVSQFWLVRAAVVIALFFVTLELLELPFSLYRHHISLAYGLSVQQWSSWFGDWAKGLALTLVVGIILGWIFYGVLRRSPRRWWFYFWLITIPFLLFAIFIQPILIDPLFNKFEPLTDHHPDLVEQIERVVHRAGMEIPPARMFEMKASEKTNELNAYVTGFGSSKRVVVWDTTIQHMSIPQTLFVFGHEMGHYVLGHLVKGFVIAVVSLFVFLYLTFRIANWLMRRNRNAWGIRDLSDFASAPMLLLVFYVLSFLSEPASNAISRHFEHEADIYGLEITHNLVADSGRNAAESFQILGERSLDYPYVGKFAELWLWSHPTIADREIFAQTYNPWAEGKQPKFVK
ncbi:MAG: M48 family metallopeptidase [Candidatus Korobacteraceae bacterium]